MCFRGNPLIISGSGRSISGLFNNNNNNLQFAGFMFEGIYDQ